VRGAAFLKVSKVKEKIGFWPIGITEKKDGNGRWYGRKGGRIELLLVKICLV